MTSKNQPSGRTSEVERTCPNCGLVRPADDFRSTHHRTHCDACHAAKDRPAAEQKPAPARQRSAGERRLTREQKSRRCRLNTCAPGAPDTCPVLGYALDAGPRSAPHTRPTQVDGEWMSMRAAEILRAGASSDELLDAAEWLQREG